MAEETKKEFTTNEEKKEDFSTDSLSETQRSESHEPAAKSVRSRVGKHKRWLLPALSLVVLMLLGTFAWYVIVGMREVDSKDTDVMTPYMLYLLNPTDEQSLALTIGNLHPGETKQAVVCVSSQKPDVMGVSTISKDSEFAYELELAYTENLALNYDVYELEPVSGTQTGTGFIVVGDENGSSQTKTFKKAASGAKLEKATPDVSEDRRKEMYGGKSTNLEAEWDNIKAQIVNLGQYDSYKKDSANQELSLNTRIDSASGTVEYDKDYYLIEMSWKQTDAGGNPIRFEDYTKETDLIYIIVKAMQPEPVERN